MDAYDISRLIKVIYDKDFMPALEAYINYRLEIRRDALEQGSLETDERQRGAIDELRKLKNLKETVLAKRG
jgi:hypothetical protein